MQVHVFVLDELALIVHGWLFLINSFKWIGIWGYTYVDATMLLHYYILYHTCKNVPKFHAGYFLENISYFVLSIFWENFVLSIQSQIAQANHILTQQRPHDSRLRATPEL
jgi:hypothetical protein